MSHIRSKWSLVTITIQYAQNRTYATMLSRSRRRDLLPNIADETLPLKIDFLDTNSRGLCFSWMLIES